MQPAVPKIGAGRIDHDDIALELCAHRIRMRLKVREEIALGTHRHQIGDLLRTADREPLQRRRR